MMAEIEEEELPEVAEYIHSRNGVDFIPSSMVILAVDSKLRLEMGAEGMFSRINLCKVISEEVAETFQGQIRTFDSQIPTTVKVGEFVYYREPLIEYTPGNGACKAYRMLAKEVVCA